MSDNWPSRNFELITQDAYGRPLRWRDRQGVVHAVEQCPKDEPANVASCWTRCGGWNISRAQAWGGQDKLTCQSCWAIEYQS
jgi:hypothetical protein